MNRPLRPGSGALKPISRGELLLLFAVPTTLNALACSVAIPWLDVSAHLPIEVAYFLSVGLLVLVPMFVGALVPSAREAGSGPLAAILERMRVRHVGSVDWIWAIATVSALGGASYLIADVAMPRLGMDPVPSFFRDMPLAPEDRWILGVWPAFFLLDRSQEPVRQTMTDSLGRFRVEAPHPGEYYLVGQSLGYAQTLLALLAVGERTYELDIELTPDPIRLDPLQVSVRNKEMFEWFRFNRGVNPSESFGFRAIQGGDLVAAQQRARDNTDLLRWLYIPVTHGREACVGHRFVELERGSGRSGPPACGKLYVDGYERPVEHIEALDRWSIAVVVVIPPDVHFFTRGLDWSFRPGSPGRGSGTPSSRGAGRQR